MHDIDQEYLCDLDKELVFEILETNLFEDLYYNFRHFLNFTKENGEVYNFKYYMAFHLQPRRFEIGEDIVCSGERTVEIYFVQEGTIGVGPSTTSASEGATSAKKEKTSARKRKGATSAIKDVHHPYLFFTKPTIVGDYEVLMDKPSFATFRVYKEAITDCF